MVNIASQVPYGDDAIIRKQQDLERHVKEQAASRGLGASEIGNGGELLVQGSLRVTGSITVPGTLSSAGNLSAGVDVNAARDVNATRNVNATGNVNGSTGVFPAGVTSTGVYNNLVSTGGYKVQYINVSGQMGYVPSSRRFKQDIVDAPDVKSAALAIQVVTFRYIQAVEELGDDAALEWGVIAEDIHALGLNWLVDYDEDGKPLGVKYERLALAMIPVIQDHENRLKAAGL